MSVAGDLYEHDFHAWAARQAKLLRARRIGEADLDHIAEEIESLGRSEKRELVSRLTILLLHLLKWRYQPGLRGPSWRNSIRIQRIRIAAHMRENPSLRAGLAEAIADAFHVARIEAEAETGLEEAAFPADCPWTFETLLDETFWPE